MWTEYRDKAKAKRINMLDEERTKVLNALAQGQPRPPSGAYLEHVIEALWYNAIVKK